MCMMRCSAFITGAATPQGNRLVAKYYGDDMATEEQQVSHSSTSYTIRGSAAQPRSHCRSSQFAFEKLLFSKTSRIQAARHDSELTLPDLSLRRLWLWRVPLRRRHSDELIPLPFAADIIMLDSSVVVFHFISDCMFYVSGKVSPRATP